MAAYRRVYDSRHLQADCQEPGSAPEPYARQSSIGRLYLFVYMCGLTDTVERRCETTTTTMKMPVRHQLPVINPPPRPDLEAQSASRPSDTYQLFSELDSSSASIVLADITPNVAAVAAVLTLSSLYCFFYSNSL